MTLKYNKSFDDIKKEYGLEHLHFYTYIEFPGPEEDCACSITAKTNQKSFKDPLQLKYVLYQVENKERSIYFIELRQLYDNIEDLRRDSMILLLSGT